MKMIPIVSGTAPMACDEQDYLMLSRYHWRALTNAHHQYAKTQIRGHTILAHRLILGLEKGDQRVADHINGNGLDNRRCNLRIVTRKENRWNLRKTNSLSGIRGVVKVRNGYSARFVHDGEYMHLGCYETKEEAAFYVKKKLLELCPEFSYVHDFDRASLRNVWKGRIDAYAALLNELEAMK